MERVVGQLDALAKGCDEDDVAAFLNDTVFPSTATDASYGPTTGLSSSSSALMSQHLVPNNPESLVKVTQPKPDKLYGYSGEPDGAFTQLQMLAQSMLHPRISDYASATAQGLRFPFFAIEFKASGGTRGDLWVATNQCAGASAACLNAVHQLNYSLRQYQNAQRGVGNEQLVDNLSFCIAVDNNSAQLYISWKEDELKYYMQQIDAFLLWSPEHFQRFRKQVRNILDWGKNTRLKQIRDSLDIILEERRREAAETAKARQPPSNSSAPPSSGKRRKSSSSNSTSTRQGGQDGGASRGFQLDHNPAPLPSYSTAEPYNTFIPGSLPLIHETPVTYSGYSSSSQPYYGQLSSSSGLDGTSHGTNVAGAVSFSTSARPAAPPVEWPFRALPGAEDYWPGREGYDGRTRMP